MAGFAAAYPEGAPWGAANPEAAESCSSCHYDYEAVQDSSALSIEGLPEAAAAGGTYELRIRFAPADAEVAGFQLLAATDGDAGSFRGQDPGTESIGAATRSTVPVDMTTVACWNLSWHAPEDPGTTVIFHLAASAANDDQSPLGDRIHYRSFTVDVEFPGDARIVPQTPTTTEGETL